MVTIRNLRKAFGSKVLFDDFNLEIKSAEFVMLSGASGCGKTTLLNMIGSLEKPNEGTITVGNLDVLNRKNQLHYFGNVVGFVFQNFALIEEKTVLDNLLMIKKANRSAVTIDEALERVNLMDHKDSKIFTLSGGEQQRISLARLMIKKCDVILADEPTGSLDWENAKKVLEILQMLNEDGKTIIMVSHDERMKSMVKRVILL